MKLYKFIIPLLITSKVMASNVGIIDSGVYFDHNLLADSAWINTGETFDNWIDDDLNGKVDDYYGWNFVENSPEIFFPAHIPDYNPLVYITLEIASKLSSGTATAEEKKYFEENILSLPVEEKKILINQVNHYGQYAHGTHCAGVVAMGNPNAKIMAGKIFNDTQVPVRGIVDWAYSAFATLANQFFVTAASYLNETKMDVANYSLGVPIPMLAEKALALLGNKNPTKEEIKAESWRLFKAYKAKGEKWVASAKDTLFVIAAGNDHNNNDEVPYFPANIVAENLITVAATQGFSKLATFSNYGKEYVHVAAPGVDIVSSVPGPTLDFTLPMSGTSMAAPYVTMVASNVKDENPSLSPVEIKKILIETVDKKEWLKNFVMSSGVVNINRAKFAAKMTKSLSLDKAIAKANVEIVDIPETPIRKDNSATKEMKNFASQFVF